MGAHTPHQPRLACEGQATGLTGRAGCGACCRHYQWAYGKHTPLATCPSLAARVRACARLGRREHSNMLLLTSSNNGPDYLA
jgi:hypothetical protein